MSKPRKGKPLTYEQAVAEFPAAQKALSQAAQGHSAEYDQCVQQLHALYAIMAQEMARTELARRRCHELIEVINRGKPEAKLAIESRLTDDPNVTLGLLEAVTSGEVETKHEAMKNTPHNMVILIGGLARVKTKSEPQVLAAVRYSKLFDQAQHDGARAIDYEQDRVDTSGPRQDKISASQDDARRALANARDALNPRATSIIDAVVIGGMSVRKLATKMGHGEGGQGRRCAEQELMDAVNVLVKHFGLDPDSRPALARWSDGSKARIVREEDLTAQG